MSKGKTGLSLDATEGFKRIYTSSPNAKARIRLVGFDQKGETSGTPLDNLPETGDLSDCYKFYFDPDPSPDQPPRYRLVYRYTPNEIRAVSLQAVAVGKRAKLDAYIRALANLGRLKP